MKELKNDYIFNQTIFNKVKKDNESDIESEMSEGEISSVYYQKPINNYIEHTQDI